MAGRPVAAIASMTSHARAKDRFGLGRNTVMLVDCPDCGFPATVESRGDAGGVELLYLRCINRHWFLGPADRLLTARSPAPRLDDPKVIGHSQQ
jgi:hypothetical protein